MARVEDVAGSPAEHGASGGPAQAPAATRLPLSDPLSQVNKTSSAVTFETDTLHHVTMIEGDTDPTTTAYGMLVDMINIARGRHLDPRT